MEPVGGGCSSLVPAAACPNQGQGQQNQLLAGKQPPALPLRVWAQVPGRSEILLQDDLKAALHRDGPGQRTYAISLTSAASDRCPARGRGSERRRRGKHGKRYQCDRSVDSLHDSSREKGACVQLGCVCTTSRSWMCFDFQDCRAPLPKRRS